VYKLVAALAVALIAPCVQPDPTTTTTTTSSSTTTTTVPVDPVSIDVVGDSLTAQVYEYLGGWVDAPSSDTQRIAEAGWSMIQAQAPYNASVAANPPDVTVVALGNNDAHPDGGGWDLFDIVRWNDFFASTPTGSCIVVVLARFGPSPSAPPPNFNTWSAEVNEGRRYIVDLVTPGGQFSPPPGREVVLVDWYLPITVHPNYLGPDAIHLTGVNGNAPAHARQDQYWDGAGNCPALGGNG
jgi:hypothetical protein